MIYGKYVEAEGIINRFIGRNIFFYYLCGGRGIGKTYGAMDLCRKVGTGALDILGVPGKFLYLRRTAVEAISVASPESCPFKKYNDNEGYSICADFDQKRGFGQFYYDSEKNCPIGYVAALSTFSNLRGIDFSDVTLILYDECIPENKNKKPLRNEGFLFLNAYETINRNRILDGKPEVVVLFLSNAIDLGADLLSELSLTPIFNNLLFREQEKYTDYNRSLHIELYKDHPVSKEKEQGVLYKFAKPTGFNRTALSGEFVENDLHVIKQVKISEYKPVFNLENVTVYKHKNKELYHVSMTYNKAPNSFRVYEREKVRSAFYWQYKLMVADDIVTYDSYNTKTIFEAMIKFKPL